MGDSGGTSVWNSLYANNSMITYSGEWDLITYRPLQAGAKASYNFTGSGIKLLGGGSSGSVFLTVDNATSNPGTVQGGGGFGNETSGPALSITLPPGRHQAEFVATDYSSGFIFGGFAPISYVRTADSQPHNTTYGSADVSNLEFFDAGSGTQIWPDGKDGANVTYVQATGAGFAFNFTGDGVVVRGPENITESTTYAVYFNQSSPPSADSNLIPFDRFTAQAGKEGTLFMAASLPQGHHRLLIVNEGPGRLGYQTAYAVLPQFGVLNTTTCFVNCTAGWNKLAGAKFASASLTSSISRALFAVVALSLACSAGWFIV